MALNLRSLLGRALQWAEVDSNFSGLADGSLIAAQAITYAKLQNVGSTNRVLGRKSAGAGVVEELSAADLAALINVIAGLPVAVTHAQTPYQIPDLAVSQLPVSRTFLASTGTGVLEIDLPVNPVDGEIVRIKRTTADGTALTVGRSAKNIEGAAANFVDQNAALSAYIFQYAVATGWWLVG